MKMQNDITQEKETTPIQRVQQESSDGGTTQLVDNSESTIYQRKLQDGIHGATNQSKNPIQRKANKTGLPDNLKSGIENLSGYSMDDVKVHYNSSKPAQLQAHAYAQGTDIHLASGQEKHLPHEAWHVVQQKQGRVQPTRQLKSKVNINDNFGLEKEADVMGERAARIQKSTLPILQQKSIQDGEIAQRVKKLSKDKLNVVGELHPESNFRIKDKMNRREDEKKFCEEKTGSKNYWIERDFKINEEEYGDPKELLLFSDIFDLEGYNKLSDVTNILSTQKYFELTRCKRLINECNFEAEEKKYYTEKIERLIALNRELLSRTLNIDDGDTVRRIPMDINRELIYEIDVLKKKSFNKIRPFLKDRVVSQMIKNFKKRWNVIMKDSTKVGRIRSTRMHEAANKMANTLGVWKIGDQHVEDIERYFREDDIQYNLVNREDFNNEFIEEYKLYDLNTMEMEVDVRTEYEKKVVNSEERLMKKRKINSGNKKFNFGFFSKKKYF